VMEYHLGEVWVPEGVASVMDAKVTVILTDFGITLKSRPYIYWGGYFQRSRYLKLLRKSNILIKISKSLIDKFYNENRNIIYVSDRINILDSLDKLCNYDSKSRFIGSAKNKVLESLLTFATTSKIRDGIDAIQKDCLIMANPVRNIEQLCGRILRIKGGKKFPIVVDFVDIGEPEIRRTFNSRLNFYKSKNWNINYIYIDDKGLKNVTEEDSKTILSGE